MTNGRLKLEVIDSVSGLNEIQREWSQLLQQTPGVTPFQSPEWLMTWWRHFGNGKLRVLVFRTDAGHMVGIVPCFLHEWNGARQVTLIGSGVSDYLEPAINPEHADDIVATLERHLAARGEWDICDWQDLAAETPLQRIQGLNAKLSGDMSCSELRISGRFNDFAASLSTNLRRNLRRYREKAERTGIVQVGTEREADPELLEALIEMHGARWRQRDTPGMIEANGSADFLRAVAGEFARRAWLRMFWMRYRGRLTAMILAFEYRKKVFGYLTAFDPEHQALGFGRALLYEALRYAFENGLEAWDFLRGDEAYKSWWGAREIPKARLVLTRTA